MLLEYVNQRKSKQTGYAFRPETIAGLTWVSEISNCILCEILQTFSTPTRISTFYLLRMHFLVIEEHADAISQANQIGVVFGQLVNRLYLILQKFFFEIVAKGEFDGCPGRWPLLFGGRANFVQNRTPSSKILILDQLLSVFTFLFGNFLEEF